MTSAARDCFQEAADLLGVCGSSVEAVPSGSSHTRDKELSAVGL